MGPRIESQTHLPVATAYRISIRPGLTKALSLALVACFDLVSSQGVLFGLGRPCIVTNQNSIARQFPDKKAGRRNQNLHDKKIGISRNGRYDSDETFWEARLWTRMTVES